RCAARHAGQNNACRETAKQVEGQSLTLDSSKFIRHSIPILIGVLLLARGIGIALVPLMDTTEARYGEIGRKMAELNDWVTPWFDYGVPTGASRPSHSGSLPWVSNCSE